MRSGSGCDNASSHKMPDLMHLCLTIDWKPRRQAPFTHSLPFCPDFCLVRSVSPVFASPPSSSFFFFLPFILSPRLSASTPPVHVPVHAVAASWPRFLCDPPATSPPSVTALGHGAMRVRPEKEGACGLFYFSLRQQTGLLARPAGLQPRMGLPFCF